MWHGPKVVASERWTVRRGFSVPFGRSVITCHTLPVPHGPRTNSMQITPIILALFYRSTCFSCRGRLRGCGRGVGVFLCLTPVNRCPKTSCCPLGRGLNREKRLCQNSIHCQQPLICCALRYIFTNMLTPTRECQQVGHSRQSTPIRGKSNEGWYQG